jgi:hypothetical protein
MRILMGLSERNEKIYELRKSGVPFTEIAKVFSISGTRARHIYIELDIINDNNDSLPPLRKILSARMQKALITILNDVHIFDNPEKIVMGIKLSKLKCFPNIGDKSIKELVDAMITLGYVKINDKWLEE